MKIAENCERVMDKVKDMNSLNDLHKVTYDYENEKYHDMLIKHGQIEDD